MRKNCGSLFIKVIDYSVVSMSLKYHYSSYSVMTVVPVQDVNYMKVQCSVLARLGNYVFVTRRSEIE